MKAHARHAACADVGSREQLLHAARGLVYSVEFLAARRASEGVAVCNAETRRLLELESRAIDAGVVAARRCGR